MSRSKIYLALALAALVAGAAVLVTGVDRALVITSYDQSLYITVLALVFVAGDALRRALRR